MVDKFEATSSVNKDATQVRPGNARSARNICGSQEVAFRRPQLSEFYLVTWVWIRTKIQLTKELNVNERTTCGR